MKDKPKEQYKLDLKELIAKPEESYHKINCPSCDHLIPAADININDKIAKCSNCNVVFSFQPAINNLLQPKKVKQEVLRPEGIDLFYFKNVLDITIQQPLTPFELIPIIFFPFLAVLLSLAYFTKGKISFLWPALMWIGTAISSILAINNKKHKIYLTIDERYLIVKWRPKKFKKDQQYDIQNISQLYIAEKDGRYHVYIIVDGIDGQKHINLISGISSISKARYLEQEIEKHLNIEDRKIPEELQ